MLSNVSKDSEILSALFEAEKSVLGIGLKYCVRNTIEDAHKMGKVYGMVLRKYLKLRN
jgi:hypothetical protein